MSLECVSLEQVVLELRLNGLVVRKPFESLDMKVQEYERI